MNLLDQIFERAKNNLQRIVLPEGTEIRTLKAADIILKEKTAKRGVASVYGCKSYLANLVCCAVQMAARRKRQQYEQ